MASPHKFFQPPKSSQTKSGTAKLDVLFDAKTIRTEMIRQLILYIKSDQKEDLKIFSDEYIRKYFDSKNPITMRNSEFARKLLSNGMDPHQKIPMDPDEGTHRAQLFFQTLIPELSRDSKNDKIKTIETLCEKLSDSKEEYSKGSALKTRMCKIIQKTLGILDAEIASKRSWTHAVNNKDNEIILTLAKEKLAAMKSTVDIELHSTAAFNPQPNKNNSE